MKTSRDPIIHNLVRKKKELLSRLLALSIQSAIDENAPEDSARNRARLISALSVNDEALETREQDTGISAGTQETKLLQDIETILQAIQENNTQVISRLERDIRQVERERFQLLHGNKLTGYIAQQNGYKGRSATGVSLKSQSAGSRLLDGTL